MKKNQKGFSLPHVLLVLVLVGIVGFAGWRVYDAQKKTNESLQNASDANEVVKQDKKEAPKEDYKPPEGWVEYVHKEYELSFYHPKEWDAGDFKIKQYNKDEAIGSGFGTPDSVVYVSKANTWERFLNYGTSAQKKLESDGNEEYGLKTLTVAGHMYPFGYIKLVHGGGVQHYVYVADGTKVYAISLPPISTMESSEAVWKKTVSDQAAAIQDIIKSARFFK